MTSCSPKTLHLAVLALAVAAGPALAQTDTNPPTSQPSAGTTSPEMQPDTKGMKHSDMSMKKMHHHMHGNSQSTMRQDEGTAMLNERSLAAAQKNMVFNPGQGDIGSGGVTPAGGTSTNPGLKSPAEPSTPATSAPGATGAPATQAAPDASKM